MRCILTTLATSLLSTASLAAQPVVTENVTRTITGPSTIDTNGYFGTAGDDLTGAKVSVFLQYVPNLLGQSQPCRNHSRTYNGSYSMPDTPGRC
jgi:hypothetical protein